MTKTEMSPEERAKLLRWPDERNCDWDCPWPSYCLDCHGLAWNAMMDARSRLIAFLTQKPIEDVWVITKELAK